METTNLREDLKNYISRADEERVQALYTLVKDDMLATGTSPEQWALIEQARARYLADDSEAAPWDKVLERLTSRIRKMLPEIVFTSEAEEDAQAAQDWYAD